MFFTARRPAVRLAVALIAAVIVSGCASGPRKYSMKKLEVEPPSLMVGKKSNRTLYLVLDPKRVPNKLSGFKWNLESPVLTNVHEFVKRDVANSLSAYFADVQVVAPDFEFPSEPHMVATVKIDKAGKKIIERYAFAQMTWGFAMRPSESEEYVFSYAGKTLSEPSTSATEMFRTMFENALLGLMKSYADNNVHQTVLSLPEGDAPLRSKKVSRDI